MPGRSPHRNSPPPAPLISRHSPLRRRIRSPEHIHPAELPSTSHSRERREYRPSVRRSRSPIIQHKSRSSYSPPSKRKVYSPTRERDISRRNKLSKSPPRRSPDPNVYAAASTSGTERKSLPRRSPDPNVYAAASTSGTERYRVRDYEKEREISSQKTTEIFRGPENLVDFDVSELKKFTVQIIRSLPHNDDKSTLNRSIINPDIIAPVRRPDEGVQPLFRQSAKLIASSTTPSEEYRRIIAVAPSSRGPEIHSSERARYSPPPPPYNDSRRHYYSERVNSPSHGPRHPSPLKEEYIEPREKHQERRDVSREDLRRDLEGRRRRYSLERASSYERDSDLRSRINEKRSEPHGKYEERAYSVRRYESEERRYENEKRVRPHHSPPPKERRYQGSTDRHEGSSKLSRVKGYDRDGERKRRPHSNEREERGREHYERYPDHGEYSDKGRHNQSYKTEYPLPQKFYKPYEHKEFVQIPRGRPVNMHRGMPPVMIGRGIVRGVPARGFPMRGMPRGPRLIFPVRGFPRFFPPYRPGNYN